MASTVRLLPYQHTQLVGVFVVGDLGLSRTEGWDDDIDLGVGEKDAEVITVVAFVGNHADEREVIGAVNSRYARRPASWSTAAHRRRLHARNDHA